MIKRRLDLVEKAQDSAGADRGLQIKLASEFVRKAIVDDEANALLQDFATRMIMPDEGGNQPTGEKWDRAHAEHVKVAQRDPETRKIREALLERLRIVYPGDPLFAEGRSQ